MKKNKNILIIAIAIIFLISLIVFFCINRRENGDILEEEELDEKELETEFKESFKCEGNEYVSTLYEIEEEKTGNYSIKAKIPYVQTLNEISTTINKEINEIFTNKIIKIYNESNVNTIIDMDYKTSISNNILSLVIRFKLKEGANAQRLIIKTYNYDIENEKIINISEIVPSQEMEKIQEKINEKLQLAKRKEQAIIEQGHGSYIRDTQSSMYKIENASEFYINNNILYIIYCYGNNNYTTETDFVITKI